MEAKLDKTLKTFPLAEYMPKKRPRVPDPEVTRLLSELKAWCDEKYGRQTEVAQILGVDRKRLNDWFTGRIQPTFSVGLRIQSFLRTQKEQKRKKPEGQT